MKVLFVNTLESEYSQDILWAGLVETPTVELYSYPLHLPYAFSTRRYPKNLGAAGIKGFARAAAPIPWSEVDVVILAACRLDALLKFQTALKKTRKNIVCVLLDGGDRPEIGGDFARHDCDDLWKEVQKSVKFDHILKREMLIEKDYEKNVYPFPMGFNLHRVPDNVSPPKYEVTFWAVESHPIRTQALNLIADHFDCKKNGSIPHQTFRNYSRRGANYLRELSASKICLNFRGAGWDTLRFWEAPATQTFLLSQKPQIRIPNAFTHEANIIYCKDDLSNVIELCQFYLQNDSARNQIATAAHKHLVAHHSHKERALELIRIVAPGRT